MGVEPKKPLNIVYTKIAMIFAQAITLNIIIKRTKI